MYLNNLLCLKFICWLPVSLNRKWIRFQFMLMLFIFVFSTTDRRDATHSAEDAWLPEITSPQHVGRADVTKDVPPYSVTSRGTNNAEAMTRNKSLFVTPFVNGTRAELTSGKIYTAHQHQQTRTHTHGIVHLQ